MEYKNALSNLFDDYALSDVLDVPIPTIRKWRQSGEGPHFLNLGGHIRYHPEDVAAWVAEQGKAQEVKA